MTAHMRKQLAMVRMREERQSLGGGWIVSYGIQGWRALGVERGAYTWFSPLGEKNQAATAMATTITRPMMTLHLRQTDSRC